jgi:mono/diheme cytochrome c family protein
MNSKRENYHPFLIAGLILTLLMMLGFSIYWIGESARLADAKELSVVERVNRGRAIYQEQCAACHGAQGEGGVGPALNNRLLLKSTLDEVFFSVVRSGVPNTQMPAWSVDYGGPLTDEDVRDVVAFMRAWEPAAPEISPVVFEPSAERGALLFNGTCAVCHGDNGAGGKNAPALNDPERMNVLEDDWYRATIRNGRPAKGMPTWGTVLSPNQVEDLIALIITWRKGEEVATPYDATEQIASAIFSLEQGDPESAQLQVERALSVTDGPGAEILRNAQAQLDSGDNAGALVTLRALHQEWPLGDATAGAVVYSTNCAPCHGSGGEGGIGKALNPNEYIQATNSADLVMFLQEGRPGTAMAGFKGRLTDEQLADVIAFMRLWQSK